MLRETLKQAIRDSGYSALGLQTQTGVNRLSIGRFMKGQTDVSLEAAETLAEFLGLELRPAKSKRKD